MKKILIGLLVFGIFSTTISVSQAAEQDSQVIKVNDQYTLFLLNFKVTGDSYPTFIPTTAERQIGNTRSDEEITYSLKTAKGLRAKVGQSVSLLIADPSQKTSDGFLIEKNKSVQFTLAVLYEQTSTSSPVTTLQIEKVPVWYRDRNNLVPASFSVTTFQKLRVSNDNQTN